MASTKDSLDSLESNVSKTGRRSKGSSKPSDDSQGAKKKKKFQKKDEAGHVTEKTEDAQDLAAVKIEDVPDNARNTACRGFLAAKEESISFLEPIDVDQSSSSACRCCSCCYSDTTARRDKCGVRKTVLGPHDIEVAKKHMLDNSATQEKNEPWPLFRTVPADLRVYGTGIHLLFLFERLFAVIFLVAAIFVLPNIIWFSAGNRVEVNDWKGPSSTVETLAKSTIANLGTITRLADNTTTSAVNVGVNSFDTRDIAFACSVLDAVVCIFVWFWAVWLQVEIVPAVVNRHNGAMVTPEDFTVFVSGLPRRLDKDHTSYAEQLKTHFQVMLRAGVVWEHLQKGMRVVSRQDNGFAGIHSSKFEPKTLRSCGDCFCCPRRSKHRDKRGRRIGVLADCSQKEVSVKWQETPELYEVLPGKAPELKVEKEEVKHDKFQTRSLQELKDLPVLPTESADGLEFEILNANLVNNLEDCDCMLKNHPEGEPVIHNISILRDFKGLLGKQVRGDFEEGLKKAMNESTRISAVAEKIDNTAILKSTLKSVYEKSGCTCEEELDVVGAFITFSRSKHRTFVFDEYRFSRTIMRHVLQPMHRRFKGHAIRVDQADSPSDVFWQNMDVPEWQRYIRKVIVGFCCMLCIMVCTGLFSASQQANKQAASYGRDIDCILYPQETVCQCRAAGYRNIYEDNPPGIQALCEEWLRMRGKSVTISVIATLTVSITNFVITLVVYRLGEFVKSTSITDLAQSVMNLTFIMQLLNMGFITVLVNAHFNVNILGEGVLGLVGNGTFEDLTPDWYVVVGGSILFVMCTNTVMPISGALQVFLFKLRLRCTDTSGLDRAELMALYTPPEFLFASRHAEQLTVLFTAIIFASGMPLLWFFAFLTLPLFYYSDKLTLFRGSHQPPRYTHELMLGMSHGLQSALWWHAAFAIWVYGNEQIPSYLMCESDESFLTEIGLGAIDFEFFSPISKRAFRVSAMPSTVCLLCMSAFNCIRISRWLFGKAIWGNLVYLYKFLLGEEDTHGDQKKMVVRLRAKMRAAGEKARAFAKVTGKTAKAAANTVATKANKRVLFANARLSASSQEQDVNQDKRMEQIWTEWDIIQHPSIHVRTELLHKPFATEPLKQMLEHKICPIYNVAEVWSAAYFGRPTGQDEHSLKEAATCPNKAAQTLPEAGSAGPATIGKTAWPGAKKDDAT